MTPRCPAAFWRFAGPVIAGNLAAIGVGYLTKKAMPNDMHPQTRDTMGLLVGGAAFWLVGGLAWVYMHPRDQFQLSGQ